MICKKVNSDFSGCFSVDDFSNLLIITILLYFLLFCYRKAKKHSKKTSPTKATSDDSGLPPIPGSPRTEESGNNSDSVKSPKRRNLPVKFYIDESEEKEHLMTAPDIVVEPPSERGSPEKWATDRYTQRQNTVHLVGKRGYSRWTIITWA